MTLLCFYLFHDRLEIPQNVPYSNEGIKSLIKSSLSKNKSFGDFTSYTVLHRMPWFLNRDEICEK